MLIGKRQLERWFNKIEYREEVKEDGKRVFKILADDLDVPLCATCGERHLPFDLLKVFAATAMQRSGQYTTQELARRFKLQGSSESVGMTLLRAMRNFAWATGGTCPGPIPGNLGKLKKHDPQVKEAKDKLKKGPLGKPVGKPAPVALTSPLLSRTEELDAIIDHIRELYPKPADREHLARGIIRPHPEVS